MSREDNEDIICMCMDGSSNIFDRQCTQGNVITNAERLKKQNNGK